MTKYMYPFPVYHAYFDNGVKTQWGLYVPANATPQIMAARGRRLARGFSQGSALIDGRLVMPLDQLTPEQLAEQQRRTPIYGANLYHGYVEDRRVSGQPWYIDDQSIDLSVVAKPRRINKKDWQTTLAQVLNQAQNGGLKAGTMAKARELLAA